MRSDQRSKLIPWAMSAKEIEGRKVMCDRILTHSTSIYHMLPWRFAKLIFEHQRLRLSPVGSWPDPYENWWCRVLFERSSGLVGTRAYGLCWTTGTHDEPRWRMAAFQREGPIVRIRCKAAAILEAGRNFIRGSAGSLYLGKVRYRKQEELLALAQSIRNGQHKDVTRTAASMLLQKRRAFEFEREIRLLWLDKQVQRNEIFVEIDPPTTISQVMTGPYTDQGEHREIVQYLKNSGVQVLRSAILDAPTHL